MLVMPALAALLTFVCLRPHEVFEALSPLSFNLMVAVVIFGYALDVRLRVARPRTTPLVWLVLAYFALAATSVAVKASERIGDILPALVAPALFFLFVSQGIQSLRGLETVAKVMLAITVFLAVLGVHQGLSHPICFTPAAGNSGSAVDETDGRPCALREDCREGGLPGVDYMCEHPGLLGTHSIAARVRYRGLLKDPNELAWAVGLGVPFAFALYELKRSKARLALLVATLILGAICTTMTKSRSGQLTFAAVLGVYMIRRYGWRGILVAMVASAPVLLLGGRSGDEADQSTQERLEAWGEGLNMWRQNPFLGVGDGQFTQHHYLTAHSSLVLTLAEMGPLGLALWTSVIYFAFKITIRTYRGLASRPEAAPARTWAIALTASLAGTLVSAAFLSIPNHPVLWLVIGLTGGLYAAVRAHDPDFEVRFGWSDLAAVGAGDLVFVIWLAGYLKYKGV